LGARPALVIFSATQWLVQQIDGSGPDCESRAFHRALFSCGWVKSFDSARRKRVEGNQKQRQKPLRDYTTSLAPDFFLQRWSV
jgi:hypothetical protein